MSFTLFQLQMRSSFLNVSKAIIFCVTRNIRKNICLPGEFLIKWTISVPLSTFRAASKIFFLEWLLMWHFWDSTWHSGHFEVHTLWTEPFPVSLFYRFDLFFFSTWYHHIRTRDDSFPSDLSLGFNFSSLLPILQSFSSHHGGSDTDYPWIISLIFLDLDKTVRLHFMLGVLSPAPPHP